MADLPKLEYLDETNSLRASTNSRRDYLKRQKMLKPHTGSGTNY
jgi:hypothetical protein